MMNEDEEAQEDCPYETNTIIKTIHNGEQGQGVGPSSATPCVADFHEYFTLVPRSQCYVHAKTVGSEFGCYTIFILLSLCLNGSIRHFLLVPSEKTYQHGSSKGIAETGLAARLGQYLFYMEYERIKKWTLLRAAAAISTPCNSVVD